MVTRTRSNSRRGRGSSQSTRVADWAVLFYIAGDVENRQSRDREAKSLHDDLNEILKAGASHEVRIAVQHDDPVKGARRFLLTERSNVNLEPVESMHKIDSGSSDVLADFLRWGLSVCPAKRVALVLGGQSALAPSDSTEKGNHRGARVFTICRDDNAGGYMDVIELGTVIRKVLNEYGREQLEMLAIDSCQTQFLELAYELEGQVEVLLAPQYWVPTAGWNYTSVLQTWKKLARQHRDELDTIFLARQLVPVIIDAYEKSSPDSQAEYFVSALDLRRLDDVARAFDTLCIGMLQVLGEGLIWKARALVLSLLNPEIRPRKAKQSTVREHNEDRLEAYDCGSLFAMLAASLEAMADESTQGWLGVALQRGSGEAFTRFRNVAAQSLEQFLRDNRDLNSRRRRERLRKWVQALRDKKPSVAGERMLKLVEKGIRDRVHLLHPDHFDAEAWKSRSDEAELCDRDLNQAIHEALRLLPEDNQVDYDRQLEAATSARRLAQQAKLAAKMLFGEELVELVRNESSDPDNTGEDQQDRSEEPSIVEEEKVSGMVVETASTTGKTRGWPRWSGVSLYRPPELDGLMNESYQGFRFHQRIHWAALLGATNLIQSHPRALWRLVSSLLATGSAGTRRDLLQRLTGRDSVIWGLRDQFRVMAPAPTLTLSLEQQRKVRRPIKSDSDKTKDRKRHQIKRSEEYVLRLESASGSAVINEQRSRVQPQVMDRALQELDELLGSPTINARSLKKLTAIGGQLGDDIFQTLGNTLENARKVVSRESSFLAPHLQLQIPRKLMSYPWELMHHNGEWLSEQFAIGRQVFMETGMARSVSRRKRGRVHPLVIGDPIFDPQVANLGWRQLPGARFEAEQVAGWFERLRQEMGEVIDFERERDTRIHTHLTNHEFRDLLRRGDYDIIHFAGHGVFDPNDPETSAWMLSDGELWALEIRSTLANHPAPPWLVYANACEAGMESRSNVRKFQRNVFGLASAFLNQGVAAYIAPLWPIDDLLAQLISTNFYRQLLSERVTLGEALRRAKYEARRVAYPDDLELASDEEWASLGWASLVLYGDPTQELFQALAGSEKTIQRSDSVRPIELSSAAMASRSGKPPVQQGRQCVHAPDRLLKEWVAGPAAINETKVAGTRGATKSNGLNLELIEESGLRR